MDSQQRKHKLDHYASAYSRLIEALEVFPKSMWKLRVQHDPWSIHEIIIHITDSEANSYIRCRRCIAEPGGGVMAYDEERWAVALQYHEQDTDDALELFRLLRLGTAKLIQNLPEELWSHTIEHPENGTMTLEDWFDTYDRHVTEHIAQMQRIYQAWQQTQQ